MIYNVIYSFLAFIEKSAFFNKQFLQFILSLTDFHSKGRTILYFIFMWRPITNFDFHYHHYYYIIIFIITVIIIIVIVIAIIISSFSMFLTFSKVSNKDTETVSVSLMGTLNSVYLIYSWQSPFEVTLLYFAPDS